MDKSQRTYKLYITSTRGNVTIDFLTAPFTIDFDIQRHNLQSTNTATIRIYNLAEKTRRIIVKDENTFDGTNSTRLGVQLDAGYGKNLSTIFKGNANRAWSVREGVDYITEIDAFDGGDAFVNSHTSNTFAKGTTNAEIINKLIGDMGDFKITKGVIGDYPGAISRGNSLVGNSTELAATVTNGGFFIDNEKAHALGDNECVQGSVTVINSATGLLGTPVRYRQKLSFDILFEPRIKMCQLITLQSVTNKNFNGIYKVISIAHRGMISYSISGKATTSLELWQGPGGPGAFRIVG